MDDVLVLAIEYAPYQTTGAFRTLYFTKYLQEFGLNPIVLTISPEASNEDYNKIYNPKLNNLYEGKATVYRTHLKTYKASKLPIVRKLSMFFKINDRLSKWWEESVENEIPDIIKKHNPKAIYISCPPFSSAELGARISKKFNIPMILDMRDGWSHWCISPFATYFHFYFTFLSEKRAFNASNKIITVTEQLKQVFLKSQPQIHDSRIKVIPNGFDIKLDYNKSLVFKGIGGEHRKIIISYVGSFYFEPVARKDMFTKWYKKKGHKIFQYTPHIEDWMYRSPYFFLKTLSALFDKFPELKKIIEFHHFGNTKSWLKDMVSELGLEESFKARGFLIHDKLKQEMLHSDLFLCTSVKVLEGEDYAIASKTFEYISSQKPILGFVTKGSQANFLEKSNSGILFNPDDVSESVDKLHHLIQNGVSLDLNEKYLKKFERRNTTKDLAILIKDTIGSN